jgi:hypothetical protein
MDINNRPVCLLLQEFDDELQVIATVMTDAGYKVITAASVLQALMQVKRTDGDGIDIVLAGLHNKASAFRALRALKDDSHLQGFPFVFCADRSYQYPLSAFDGVQSAIPPLGANEMIAQMAHDKNKFPERIGQVISYSEAAVIHG